MPQVRIKMPPVIGHLLITPFLVRDVLQSSRPQPADIYRIEHRLRMFETITLPSVLSQACGDFTWLVFFHPRLPAEFRSRLEALLARAKRAHAVPARQRVPGRLDGMTDFLEPSWTHVLTTLLDDDDAVAPDLLGRIQGEVAVAVEDGSMPPLRFFGCANALQWDFASFPDAPIGRVKPWTRRDPMGDAYPVSAGFSLCVEYPRSRFSVRAFGHHLVVNACRDTLSRDACPAELWRAIMMFRERVRQEAASAVPAWDGILREGLHYHVIKADHPTALMTNHFDNRQRARLFEDADLATPVRGPESLAGVQVDWSLVHRYIGAVEPR